MLIREQKGGRKMKRGLRNILSTVMAVVLILGVAAGYAAAGEQSVALSPTTAEQPVGSSFALSAFYEADDNTLTGLGVRFHFDSTKLEFTAFNTVLEVGSPTIETQPKNDALDLDDDPSTDKYVAIAWFSITGEWPNVTLPAELAQLAFTVDEAAAAGTTPVNVSFSSTAIGLGYTGVATNSVITITRPPGSIIGTIAYAGTATGTFEIGAYSDENLQNLVAQTTQGAPGGFEITDVPPGTYYVGATLDLVNMADREPAGEAGSPVTVVSGQPADAGIINVYHIATKIILEANPSRISSVTVSESTLTATIMDDHGYAVTDGPDSALEVLFGVTDSTYGDIKDVQINPVVAANGMAGIIIESKVDEVGGPIPCTAGATGAQGQGNLTQGTETVETGPFAIAPAGPIALLVNETQEFNVQGGTAPYAWSVEGGGALDKTTTQTAEEKIVFSAPELETIGITVTVTDDEDIASQATINVYNPVEIPDKPTEPPIVKPGASSAVFTVGGGDEDYMWTASDANGTPIDVQSGDAYTFTAPMEGAFAGTYTIAVEDGNLFSDSFVVYVPMEFVPQSINILGGEAFDLVLAGAKVAGANPVTEPAARISGVEFLDQNLDVVPTEEMADYATFTPALPVSFIGNAEATLTLTGTNVTEPKRFQLRTTVTGDDDLTAENGLNTATTGWIRVLPTVTYSGKVVRADSALPIQGAHVIFKLGGAMQGEPVASGIDGGFSVPLPSPVITGAQYQVTVVADNYVAATGLTTAGWDMEMGETIELTEEVSSVSGTVQNDVGEGEPIQGALVQCTADAQTCLTYTNAIGEYEISLPVELDAIDGSTTTWTYQTTNNYADPCEPDENDSGTVTMTEVGNIVTIVIEDGPPFIGTVSGSDYVLSRQDTEGEETCTENVSFTLSLSGTEGTGTVTWTCTEPGFTCEGGADLTLTKQNGAGPSELLATASAAGYVSATQDILDDPDFVLTGLASGDEVGIEGGSVTSGQCLIDVPPGALNGTAQIDIQCDIDVGTETPYTQNSVALVEIHVTGADIDPNNPIKVLIPFDTADVNPGDFVAGIASIYYADTVDDLRSGTNVNAVPAEDILYEDHLNGLVSFWLSHASVFGIGGGGGPAVTTGPAISVRKSTATLTGTINPNGLATTYHFEYGEDTNYGKSTSETDAGSGTDDVSVAVSIAKLKEDTVYHFRLVAINGAGVTYGEDMAFKTKDDDDDTCFIQTAGSGFSSAEFPQLRMTHGYGPLLWMVLIGLLAGSYLLQRLVR
jgi:hypothetical protein